MHPTTGIHRWYLLEKLSSVRLRVHKCKDHRKDSNQISDIRSVACLIPFRGQVLQDLPNRVFNKLNKVGNNANIGGRGFTT